MTQTTLSEGALRGLALPAVALRCRQETERYWRREAYLPHFCLELFRRCLADPRQESSKQAWSLLHDQYHREATLWAKAHRLLPQTGVEPQELAELALEKMWLSFATAPHKFDRFPVHDPDKCLRMLLSYLKTCVNSVVVDAVRGPDQNEDVDALEHVLYHSDPDSVEEFWQCVYDRLNDQKERLVMDASFVYELKPRQIYAMYPDMFQGVTDIHRTKENILARFRRDPGLRACLER